MIDEKKLIEEVKKHRLEYKESDSAIGVKVVLELIEQQPKTDWIPCEERLPSVGDAVLVVDEYALYDVCTVIERYGEMMLENSSGCWLDIENYIAWQPLPTPYKKEGAE